MHKVRKEEKDLFVKRYLTTDTLKTEFPYEFVYSRNRRFVEILSIHLFIDDSRIDDQIEAFNKPKFITFHSDFVQDMRHLNCYVCLANYRLTKRKKYELLNNQTEFNIWFTDIDGTVLNADNLKRDKDGFYIQTISPTVRRRFKFYLELKLQY